MTLWPGTSAQKWAKAVWSAVRAVLAGERAVRGAGDVGAQESFVQRGRDLGEYRGIGGHEPEEVRAPGSQRDHVDQGQRPVAGAVQQVSAQGHRAPVVMDDQVRLAELPVLEQIGKQAGLRSQGDVLAFRHRGGAIAEHVPQVHGEVAAQRVGDAAPQRRSPRGAVTEHQRRPLAMPRPPDLLITAPGERFLQHYLSIAAAIALAYTESVCVVWLVCPRSQRVLGLSGITPIGRCGLSSSLDRREHATTPGGQVP